MLRSILIIEDDLFLREVYADILINEGYRVETAEDGEAGLKKLLDGEWDLVLLDMILPKREGIEIMKEVRKQKTIYPKVVFLSNMEDDTLMKEALKLGSGYLVKSRMTPDQFIAAVKGYMV